MFALCACGGQLRDRPTSSQLAQFCDVRLAELQAAKSQLKQQAMKVLKIGSCSLVKADDGQIKVVAVRAPPQAPR